MKTRREITTIPALRLGNESALLRIVWNEKVSTRRELSHKTSLTPNTVSSIVNNLISRGIFTLTGKEGSTGGRQPDIISFNPRCRLAMGISIGVYRTKGLITDLYGNKIKEINRQTPNMEERQDVLSRTSAVIDELLSDFASRDLIHGVGVSFPGTVNHTTGIVMDSSILGNARHVNIKRYIEERYRIPALVENNVNLCALNEALLGAGRNKRIVLFVFAGYGIGSGLAINGEIYDGARDSAGNLGHLVIEPNGRKCYCGSYGCLETVASFPALFEDFQGKVKMGAKTLHTSVIDRPFSVQAVGEIFDWAREGDNLAVDLINTVGLYIGIATANLIGILNPDIVVFGGEYSEIKDLIIGPIQNAVKSRAWITIKDTKMVFSSSGFDADLWGAVAMVIRDFINAPKSTT